VPLTRILLGRRSVDLAGRRFVVRPPTVRTYYLALHLFGRQIALIRELAAERPDGTVPAAAAISYLAIHPEALRELLSTCVDGDLSLLPGSDLSALAMAAIEQFSPAAAVELLGPPDSDAEVDSDAAQEDGSFLILGAAERFHIDPSAVLEWPIDIFADVVLKYGEASEAKRGGRGLAAEAFAGLIPVQHVGPVIGGPTPAPDEDSN